MKRSFAAAASFAALTISYALPTTARAQDTLLPATEPACHGATIAGTVKDSTEALIPGATVVLDGGASTTTGTDGRFHIPCVADGPHTLHAAAEGFASHDVALKTVSNGKPATVDVVLAPESVETNVEVNGADDTPANSANSAGPTQTISGNRLQALADDPDDLARELQQLAAATGGNPANTTIAVDGFQGSSALPPKSSIAYIKINPDQFAAEYRQPPFDGGRVEVYTKPGMKTYHGALFTTQGEPFENAKDPFSTSKAAIGKQRYGLEFSGPVRKVGSDFAVTLEHRSINNFAVVDAFNVTPTTVNQISQNVATPQRLWLGTARVDWQLGPKNTFIVSYSANVNHLANLGAGGTSTSDTAFDADKYEHMFRLSDVTTASAHLMHEARLSLRWDGQTDVPQSTAPQVSIAGASTSGGATIGQQRLKELNTEFDDDAIWTTKAHTFKFGTQLMVYQEHQELTTNFNGSYSFGGGLAPVLDANNQPIPGQTTTITGIQQYQRALSGYAGGTPTTYTVVTGTPLVTFTQVQEALFFEDDWKLKHGVQVSYGLRYSFTTSPTVLDGITPRLGVLWSPTKKGTWTLHAHVGTFTGGYGTGSTAEVFREDGVNRVTSTVYNANYCAPGTSSTCSPFPAGSTPIHSVRQFAPGLGNTLWSAENIGGTRTLPHGWNLSLDYYLARIWNDTRTLNINSPLTGSPTGPRALGIANTNILQVQNSGQGHADVVFAGVENHSYKRVQFFFGGVRVNLKDDTDDSSLASPQSAFSDVGEFAYRDNQPVWNVFGNATVNLPGKLQFSTNFNGSGDKHYNITTGFDNNGDGNFNDRPQYALPGTPTCNPTSPAATLCAHATPYGLLVSSGGTGVFPRNKGVMPWGVYLDTNLQRAFKFTRNAKADHQQTLTVNIRSSNVLNHLNVTSVGGVLGSPLFGQAYSADPGRRVEVGARYSF